VSNDNFIISSFVRHPPQGDLTINEIHNLKLCISELDNCGNIYKLDDSDPFDARMLLILKKGEFDRTQNPIVAMEGFIVANQAGLYPPLWVLNFFTESFEIYHENLGEVSLDKVLGLTRGKGQTNAFKELIIKERNENIIKEAYRLCHLFNMSIEKAAYMVFRRIEHMNEQGDWNKTPLTIRALSEDSIRDLINRGDDPFKDQEYLASLPNMPIEGKLKWIAPYPDDSLPEEVRKLV